MGVQNIIKPPQEETPSSDSFFENGPFFDEAEPPVIIDLDYGESDTESFSELQDADDLLNVWSSWSSFDVDVRTPPPPSVEMESIESRQLRRDTNTTVPTVNNENKQVYRTKSSSMKSVRNKLGKKKARRLENARQLALLAEDDYFKYDNDFMPSECPFRFSQILEDADLTNKILNSNFDDIDEFRFDMDFMKSSHKKKTVTGLETNKTLSPDEAFDNLDSSQKSFIKRRNLPMGMIEYLDTCVFSFFENNPTGTYISEPLTSFQRMAVHCIAQYYDLNSKSFDAEDRIERLTQVTNAFNYFKPPCLCLSQYLEKHLLEKNLNSGPASKRRRYKRRQC